MPSDTEARLLQAAIAQSLHEYETSSASASGSAPGSAQPYSGPSASGSQPPTAPSSLGGGGGGGGSADPDWNDPAGVPRGKRASGSGGKDGREGRRERASSRGSAGALIGLGKVWGLPAGRDIHSMLAYILYIYAPKYIHCM